MAITSSTPVATNPYAALNGGAAAPGVTQNEAGSADRFLKLLVAQMKNQDPLNPMDNAQVTSQMAQINTVDGISKLNQTVKGLNTQFVQLQALQGASLVGRDVTVAGNRLAVDGGVGEGAFELGSSADRVKLEVLSGAGLVIGSQDLGALSAGRHNFEWPSGSHTDADGLRFRITAYSGAALVNATTLAIDRVEAVSLDGDTLTLQLQRSGAVSYGDVKSVQ
jgi:flagellar basal-body rod modification protein FlgD